MLKQSLVVVAFLLVSVAYVAYTPIPEGMKDPPKVQVFAGIFRLLRAYWTLKEYAGYGAFLNTMRSQNVLPKQKGALPSAAFGDVMVKRDVLAGVPVIVYRPNSVSETDAPAIVFIHGGGWVGSNAEYYDGTVYEFSKCTNTVIINVNYRLAPTHPFPAGVQDCIDVTKHVLRQGKQLGIDVTKVGVAGDSAGGNLAAAVAVKLTMEKSKLPPLAFQLLHYPVLQGFDFRLPSYVDLNDTLPILSAKDMAAYTAIYMGLDEHNITYFKDVLAENRHISPQLKTSKFAEFVDVKLLPKAFRKPNKTAPAVTAPFEPKVFAKIKHIVTNPLFSPLMAQDLTGVPPAFIHVCEFDVLRDDAFLYARRLQDAKVKVSLHFGRGGFHGDIAVPHWLRTGSSDAASEAACSFVNKMFQSKR